MIGHALFGSTDLPRSFAFYGAYVRDPDGNKLCAFRVGPA